MFSGSVSIPSITKSRPEPGRSMSASSGLSASKCLVQGGAAAPLGRPGTCPLMHASELHWVAAGSQTRWTCSVRGHGALVEVTVHMGTEQHCPAVWWWAFLRKWTRQSQNNGVGGRRGAQPPGMHSYC